MSQEGIDPRHLRSFRETVEAGSVRGAADRLDVEPSVVSRHLHRLQADLGVTLLERRGRGIAPTEAAAVLMEFCSASRDLETRLLERLAETGDLLHGRVHIAAGEGFMQDLMRWVLKEFCGLHPDLEVTLEQVGARDVVRLVAQDHAHVGIAYGVRPDPPADIVASRCQPVCAVMAPDHPLAGSRWPVSLRDVARFPTAQMTPGFGLQQIVSHAALADGVVFASRLVTNSMASLRDFAASGLGVAFMSARYVAREVDAGDLVALRTTNRVLNEARVNILTRTGRRHGRAAREVLEFVVAQSRAWETGLGPSPESWSSAEARGDDG
jgi:DNA-binding transcriptional LysR family regulator